MKALTNRRSNAPKLSRLARLKRISRRKRRDRVEEEREIKVLQNNIIDTRVRTILLADAGLVKMTRKQLNARYSGFVLFGGACALLGTWLGWWL